MTQLRSSRPNLVRKLATYMTCHELVLRVDLLCLPVAFLIYLPQSSHLYTDVDVAFWLELVVTDVVYLLGSW